MSQVGFRSIFVPKGQFAACGRFLDEALTLGEGLRRIRLVNLEFGANFAIDRV